MNIAYTILKKICRFFKDDSMYPEEACKRITKEYAISKAREYGLAEDIRYCIEECHMSPIAALDDWDLLDYKTWS